MVITDNYRERILRKAHILIFFFSKHHSRNMLSLKDLNCVAENTVLKAQH
jgi:hypothetical protein